MCEKEGSEKVNVFIFRTHEFIIVIFNVLMSYLR